MSHSTTTALSTLYSDIMFAAVVVPLFGVFYTPGGNPSPRAAFLSVVVGATTRVVLEFALPKDGYLILPYNHPEFVDYGPAASADFPTFFDMEEVWDPEAFPCDAPQLEDYTGVDSLAAPLGALIVYVVVTMLERASGGPLFTFPGLEGYEKYLGDHEEKDIDETKKVVEEGDDKEEASA